MIDPPILIVTGPPGSGKTTVAALLVARRERAVHIETDVFFRFIRSGFIEPWKPDSHAQNSVIMGIVGEAAARYARAGYFTVIDGIISPRWFFQPLRDALGAYGLAVAYTILRPALETAVSRASARRTAGVADPAVIAQLFDDFDVVGPLADHRIDNDAMTVVETADLIEQRLRTGELLV